MRITKDTHLSFWGEMKIKTVKAAEKMKLAMMPPPIKEPALGPINKLFIIP